MLSNLVTKFGTDNLQTKPHESNQMEFLFSKVIQTILPLQPIEADGKVTEQEVSSYWPVFGQLT